MKPYVAPKWARRAWIVDVDGTLALMEGRRGPFEWGRVDEDAPNTPVVNLVRTLALDLDAVIIVMTGRDSVCREQTEAWLKRRRRPVRPAPDASRG